MNEQGRHTPSPLPGPDVHVDDWAELALDYADGSLGVESRVAVEQHLAACEACRSVLAQQTAAAQVLRAAPLAEAPATLEVAVFGTLGLVEAEAAAPAVGSPHVAEQATRPSREVVLPRMEPVRPGLWTRLQGRLPRARVWLPAAAVLLLLAVTLASLPLARQAADEPSALKSASSDVIADSSAAARQSVSTSAESATGTLPKTTPTAFSAPTAPTATSTGVGATGFPATEESGLGAVAAGTPGPSTSPLTPYVVEARAPSDSHPAALLVGISLGVGPVPSSLWLGGPTFAVFVPRVDLNALLARLQRTGLTLTTLGHQAAAPGSPVAVLAHAWRSYPALVALDVGDPLGPVFIPEGLGDADWDVSQGSLVLLVLTMTD